MAICFEEWLVQANEFRAVDLLIGQKLFLSPEEQRPALEFVIQIVLLPLSEKNRGMIVEQWYLAAKIGHGEYVWQIRCKKIAARHFFCVRHGSLWFNRIHR